MAETIIPETQPAPAGHDVPMQAYAVFCRRFWAFIFDRVILTLIALFVLIPLNFTVGFGQMVVLPTSFAVNWMSYANPTLCLQVMVLDWLYFALSESSGWQATIGKRVLGLRVIDMEGHRIGVGRASVRYFAKYLSAMFFMIGYIMIAFTSKKQGLHDMIAETLVVKQG